MTDGMIVLDDAGVETKHFHVRDGMAFILASCGKAGGDPLRPPLRRRRLPPLGCRCTPCGCNHRPDARADLEQAVADQFRNDFLARVGIELECLAQLAHRRKRVPGLQFTGDHRLRGRVDDLPVG